MIGIAISYLLILHFIGDWLLQTKEIADKKSTSVLMLSYHVSIYTLTLFAGIILPFLILGVTGHSLEIMVKWVFLNSILHWITDYFTSKITKKYLGVNDTLFWRTVGFDQLIHGVTLVLTFVYINQIFK